MPPPSPPSLFFTIKWLIHYGLFICWKFGFVLISGCTTSNVMWLSISTLCRSSLWRIDSIFWMFEKTQKCSILVNSLGPLSNKPPPPSNTLEINKPPMARGLNRGFMLWRLNNRHINMLTKVDDFNCAVVILQSNVLSVLFGFLLNLT